MYASFAHYYDCLTANVDYAARADYFCRLIQRHRQKAEGLLLDLGCGTGSLTFELAHRGWDLIGVDASEEMLSVACARLARYEGERRPLFLHQRMEALDLFGTVDVCVSALDCINHITSCWTLEKVFTRLSLFIETGGLFVFDANTPYKHESILSGQTFVYDEPEVYCVWQNSVCSGGVVEIGLDFFEKTGDNRYCRHSESFAERAYSTGDLVRIARMAGFELLGVYHEDSFAAPRADSQRLVYVMENMKEHSV